MPSDATSSSKRLRYQDVSVEARQILSQEGESHRFEFKETAEAVDARVLTAAANAVLVDEIAEGLVTILVGVKEVTDEQTGVVRGEVVGLVKMNDERARHASLEKARQKIQSRASETLPVPVGLRIIEEGVDTAAPFLRLEVRPTRAPHYTRDGLRVTRYGASTRAITDEELIDVYLVREAEAFRQRFTEIAGGLTGTVETLRGNVEATSEAIMSALKEVEDNAGYAAVEASEAASALREIEMELRDRPTSAEVIDWLEHGDLAIAAKLSRVAAHLTRRINSQRVKPTNPRPRKATS
ncbi:AlbA family DNA-binding domain-containing protein [Micromonospora parva]|uniref:AlbA family DNA-binding domain-containing protein n=1 Tax=Micromonospora parva TaxID=1464048 RepID=UPI0033C056B0